MIKPEQVPEEVWKALRREVEGSGLRYWPEIVAAAINAWEGASHEQDQLGGNWHRLILPLPQEASDGAC